MTDMLSRRLPVQLTRGSHPVPIFTDTESRRLSVTQIWRDDDSPYHKYRKFSINKFSGQLPVPMIRGVGFRLKISQEFEVKIANQLCKGSMPNYLIIKNRNIGLSFMDVISSRTARIEKTFSRDTSNSSRSSQLEH
jgi:hypothetical protein